MEWYNKLSDLLNKLLEIQAEVDRMVKNKIEISPNVIEIVDNADYSADLVEHFSYVPEVAKTLLRGAKTTFNKIESMLYSAPAFINAVKASVPEETFQAILTDDQKSKIASGPLS